MFSKDIYKKYKFDYLVLFLISILFSFKFIFEINIHGEDEATIYLKSLNLYNYVSNFDFINIIKLTLQFHHPPARYYISLPFFLIFEEGFWIIRIVNQIMWVFTCLVIYKISKKIINEYALIITLIITCSGFFSIYTLGLGLSGVCLFVSLCTYELIKSPIKSNDINLLYKVFFKCNLYLLIAFLFYNTVILIIFSIYLIFIFYLYKSKIKKKFINKLSLIGLIFGIIYIIYYLIFLGIPIWTTHFNGVEFINKFFEQPFTNPDINPWGQYHQYISRANSGDVIAYKIIINNIKAINWIFFPILGLIFFIASVSELFKRHKEIFFLFLLYLILFNLYFKGTAAHFLVIFTIMLPFGIKNVLLYFGKLKNFFLIFLFIIISTFSYFTHIRSYTEVNYPYTLLKLSRGIKMWPQNLGRPFREIDEFLNNIKFNKSNYKILNAIDQGNQLVYMPNLNWIVNTEDNFRTKLKKRDMGCLKFDFNSFDVILTHKKYRDICKDNYLKFIYFDNSLIYLVINENSIKNIF